MSNNVLKLLDQNSYRNFKGWITETGNINPVFVAGFKHPAEESPIDMYCKIYSLSAKNRSIFNEIAGYLMADALGLPQPKYACIALMPTKQLKKNLTFNFKDKNLEREIFRNDFFPIFCTSKIDPSETALQYYQGAIEVVAAELSKWPEYGRAMAMDNTICHADRHMNNILRTGTNQYHLIDNGILLNPNGWSVTELEPSAHFRNVLLDISQKLMTKKQYNKIKGKAILACDEHKKAFDKIEDELIFWSKALYGAYRSEYNDFVDFLNHRVVIAPGLLTSRLQMLI